MGREREKLKDRQTDSVGSDSRSVADTMMVLMSSVSLVLGLSRSRTSPLVRILPVLLLML